MSARPVRDAPGELRGVLRRAGRRRHHGARGRPAAQGGYRVVHRALARGVPATWSSRPARTVCRACPRAWTAPRCSRPTATATRRGWHLEACSWSGPPRPACRSPTSSTGPVARCSSRWVGTPGCRASTAAWTSSGGWRAPADSLARSTRSPTRRRPVVSRRCSWSADPAEPGHPRDLDLATLQAGGVRLVGRFDRMDGARARFRPDLADSVAAADDEAAPPARRRGRLRRGAGLSAEVWPAARPRPLDVPAPTRFLDLARERIGTVLVATGYRPDYPWLRLPITRAGRQHPPGARRHRRTRRVRRRASVSSIVVTPASSTAPATTP